MPSESIQTYSAMTIPLWSRSVYLLVISDREMWDSDDAWTRKGLSANIGRSDGGDRTGTTQRTMANVVVRLLKRLLCVCGWGGGGGGGGGGWGYLGSRESDRSSEMSKQGRRSNQRTSRVDLGQFVGVTFQQRGRDRGNFIGGESERPRHGRNGRNGDWGGCGAVGRIPGRVWPSSGRPGNSRPLFPLALVSLGTSRG